MYPPFTFLNTLPGYWDKLSIIHAINPSTGSRGQIDPRPYKLFNIEK